MGLVIAFGLLLIVTPYIAEWLYPASHSGLRSAKTMEVKQALAEWFNTPVDTITEGYAIKQLSAQGTTAWFGFKMPRKPVESFINRNHLQQLPLTPELLQRAFMNQNPPAQWWQPAALQRETYFKGSDANRELGLIYNADLEQGYLLVITTEERHHF